MLSAKYYFIQAAIVHFMISLMFVIGRANDGVSLMDNLGKFSMAYAIGMALSTLLYFAVFHKVFNK